MKLAKLFQKLAGNFLKSAAKILAPPYSFYDLVIVVATLFILLTIPLTMVVILQSRDPRSSAANENCTPSLQTLINNAAAGSTLTLPNCIYRETVTINKALTLDGAGGAQIRGSDIWTGWVQNGNRWVSSQVVPTFDIFQDPSRCRANTDTRCLKGEQVFIDGSALHQVAVNPTAGQFSVDSSRKITLGENPNGKLVEVTTRQWWVRGGADNVTVKGFLMKHAATDALRGAISNCTDCRDTSQGGVFYSNWVVANNNLSDTHGSPVSLRYKTGLQLLNNEIFRGGMMNIHSNNTDGMVVSGNKIYQGHTEDYAPGWGAGGYKAAVEKNLVVDSNEVYENDGPGLWCDIQCINVIYSNNRVYNNSSKGGGASPGIFFEVSDGAKIFGNKVWNNTGPETWGYNTGILVSSSRNAEVFNNVVAWNKNDQISVISQIRSDHPAYSEAASGHYVHDNFIFGQDTTDADPDKFFGFGLGWYRGNGGPMYDPTANNRGASNKYWYPLSESAATNIYGRFNWTAIYKTLAEFNATPGEEGGVYLSDSQKNQILLENCVPLDPDEEVPCTPSSEQEPYGGTPRAIPGTIQAEEFDLGGEGVAYHDLDTSNNGGAFRINEGVDIKTTIDADGGYTVGWFQAGEWLEYTVDVAQTGVYNLAFRVGSALAGRSFSVTFNDETKGTVQIPQMPDWDQYQTVILRNVALAAGQGILKVQMGSSDFADFNWLSIIPQKIGDINGDGQVNIFDLSILLSKWGSNDANADLDGNGRVDIFDLSILLSKWGN